MKRQLLPLGAVAVITAVLAACQRPELQEHPGTEGTYGNSDSIVQIKADCCVQAWDGFDDTQDDDRSEDTKSLIGTRHEGVVQNINALVFRSGPDGLEFEPHRSRYFEDTNVHLLVDGTQAYKVYFLANCGKGVLEQACELGGYESIMQNLRVEFSNYADNTSTEGLPMICETYIGPGGAGRTLQLRFKRLYSRIAVHIDSSELEYSTYKIKSLNLINAPKAIYPLSGASKIRDARDACSESEADAASRQDILLLNKKGTAYLYVLENVQGVLLPGNDDCAAKTPGNLIQAGHGDLLENNCLTNLCMQVSADTPWAAYDNIALQAYLGGNATSDFSIVRNSAYVLTLKLTADKVIRSEWRIEPDRPVKEYNPRMEVKLDTYRDARKMWQPRISVTCADCEKITQIAGPFLEQTKAELTISSHHRLNTQFRILSTWQFMNRNFLGEGGALASQPTFIQPQYYSNGSCREAYYKASCTFIPKNYVRSCASFDQALAGGGIFLPGKNDELVSGDNFHAAINPGIYEPYNLYSDYFDYEIDYNRWVWSYSPENYLNAINDVIVTVRITLPEQMARVVETVYGKTLEEFVSFSADLRGGCPYTEKDMIRLGIQSISIMMDTSTSP